jgi:hypothetical protein
MITKYEKRQHLVWDEIWFPFHTPETLSGIKPN